MPRRSKCIEARPRPVSRLTSLRLSRLGTSCQMNGHLELRGLQIGPSQALGDMCNGLTRTMEDIFPVRDESTLDISVAVSVSVAPHHYEKHGSRDRSATGRDCRKEVKNGEHMAYCQLLLVFNIWILPPIIWWSTCPPTSPREHTLYLDMTRYTWLTVS